MRRLLCLLAGLLIGGGFDGGSAALSAQPPPEREVAGLEFVGNRVFSDSELAGALVTEATECRAFIFQFPFPLCPLTDWGLAHTRRYLDEAALPADLLRLRLFYRQRGYRDVRADTVVERTDGKVRILFRIEEGNPTRVDALEFRGLSAIFDPEDVRREFTLSTGDPLDLVALDRGKRELTERLQNAGYINAAVLDEYFIPSGERSAELTLHVRPGPRARIGSVEIRGEEAIGEDVIDKFLPFGPGNFYSPRVIEQSQRDLYNLAAVRFANIDTRLSEESDSLVEVTVSVSPAEPRSIRAGVGLSTTECVETEVRAGHRNFLGGARRLEITGGLANLLAPELAGTFPCSDVGREPVFQDLTYRLQVDFEQPYFFSGRNSLQGRLFLEREAVPDLYVLNSRGGEFAISRRLRARMPLTLSYRPEFTNFDARSADVFFCINFGFCQPADIEVITEPRWLSPVTAAFRYDRTNRPLSPTAGYYLSVDLEGASALTGSDYRYVRFALDAANFEELGEGLVLATRFRVGIVEPTGDRVFGGPGRGEIVHPRKRFFAGGAQSVRGYGQSLLGPSVLVVDSATQCQDTELDPCVRQLDPTVENFDERPIGGDAAFEVSVELRAGLGGPWTLVGFLDAGQVWEDIATLEAPVATPGMGIRYGSPVGPIRFDVGYNPAGPQRLPVVAELPSGELRQLEERILFDPFTHGDPGAIGEILRRFEYHISIGQAF